MRAPARPVKPLDFGGEGINGCIDAQGRLTAINFYHSRFGYVTLTSAEPFPDEARYTQPAVRAFRAGLAALDGFGIQMREAVTVAESSLLENAIPQHRLTSVSGQQSVVHTFVEKGCVHQLWDGDAQANVFFGGKLSLQRCAYTQLTEGGPIPAPPVETQVTLNDRLLMIENPHIGCICIAGLPIIGSLSVEPLADGSVHLDVKLDHTPSIHLTLTFGETRSAAEAKLALADRAASVEHHTRQWQTRWAHIPDDPILRRGLLYSLNLAVRVNSGYCLLTDHMLLPLSWNRDAYYMARALLSWDIAGNTGIDGQAIVKGHLHWMFETAERLNGAWGRCYLANGQIKDPAFQLDQQLFPLLELAEYTLERSDFETFARYRPQVEAVLSMLHQHRAAYAALYPTDETPADDPIAYPYHLSSHILFWVVLRKLAQLGMETAAEMQAIADAIRTHFVIRTADQDLALFAYASDGAGNVHLYHDANDFPTILAPVWGFCSVDDAIWRGTIEYAFSERNHEAFFDGHLGSVHTRAAWPLGDVQEIIVARLLKDERREQRAIQSLQAAAQIDGSLPEAYAVSTGDVVSRHWFAWPNAAYACSALEAFH